MKSFCFVFLFALLFSCLVSAIDVEPKNVGVSTSAVQLKWMISLNGQNPASVSFASFGFQNTATQSVTFTASPSFTTDVDEFGNSKLKFILDSARQVQEVSIDAVVSVNPEAGFVDATGDLSRYTRESSIVLLTPEIRSKAAEIVGSEKNELKKAALLAEWVHNNVVYDLSYQNAILNTRDIFEIRKGVCNEFSHLFIALARSQGIPARFSAGLVYSGEKWDSHAWAEVAINGKWYPFDPTYNEGVLLDATHFKFANGIDQNNVVEQLEARGNIDLSKVVIKRSHEVSFVAIDNFSRPPLLVLNVSNETITQGSIQTVFVSITSQNDKIAAYPIAIDAPVEVSIIADKSKLIVMQPGETQVFAWKLLVPLNLTDNFVYTYPIIVRSLSSQKQVNLTARKSGDVQGVAALNIREIRVNATGIIVTVQNAGNVAFNNAFALLNTRNSSTQVNFSIVLGEEKQLVFPFIVNASTGRVPAKVNITTEGYSIVKEFLIEPTAVQNGEQIVTQATGANANKGSSELQVVDSLRPYFPAIFLILCVAIILLLVRSRS